MIGRRGGGGFRLGALLIGFAFLYLPIALLVVYSFNGSRLVTVWGGFSARWYGALVENEKYRDAALTSLEIAVMAATIALIAGLGMPRSLGAVKIGVGSFDKMAEQAMGTPWVPKNPRPIAGPAQVREILELAA